MTEPTSCSPGNGVIQVTSVSLGTVPRYTFAFYDANPLAGATAIQDSSLSMYQSGEPGSTYYIIGTDTATQCTTGVYQIELGTDRVIYPEIDLVRNQENRQCSPGLADGLLSVSIFTTDDDERTLEDINNYTLTWTTSAGDTIAAVADTVAMTSSVDSLQSDDYAIIAVNNTTGCTTIDTLTLLDGVPPFILVPSSSPNLNCVVPNGSVSVRVLEIEGFDRPAEFFWYVGDVQSPDLSNPDWMGVDTTGLWPGTYTVIARGLDDSQCLSERKYHHR